MTDNRISLQNNKAAKGIASNTTTNLKKKQLKANIFLNIS
jgi:hypothetical protein